MGRQDGSILKLGEAYDLYWYFCNLKDVPAAPKKLFKSPAADAIKEKFGTGLRKDLKVQGKWVDGWKSLCAPFANRDIYKPL